MSDLWQTQLKRYFSYLIAIFNSDSLLYKVAKIRLFQLQQRIGHDKNPLIDWKYPLDKTWNFNYLVAVAALLYTANANISIVFNIDFENTLTPHNHLLNGLLHIKDIIKHGLPLFKHNILFLDQITTEDSK